MEKLKQRWGIQNNWSIIAIFIVFAINGSFASWVAKPVTNPFWVVARNDKPLVVLAFKNFVNFPNLSSYASNLWLVLWTV